MTTDIERKTARVRGAIALLTMTAFAVPVSYSVHAGFPDNPIKLPGEERATTMTWGPQGWKFFTREPQEEQPTAFTRAPDGTWSSALKWPNSRSDNLFGLAREGRSQGIEMGMLVHGLGKTSWQKCDDAPLHCLDESPPIEVSNPTPHPSLCGTIGVVLQPPVPFAWRNSPGVIMPSHVAKLEVKC